jgi:ubiquinol oxidase
MEYVVQNPDLEAERFESIFAQDYRQFDSLADSFRQIGYDERIYKLESLARIDAARFQ